MLLGPTELGWDTGDLASCALLSGCLPKTVTSAVSPVDGHQLQTAAWLLSQQSQHSS